MLGLDSLCCYQNGGGTLTDFKRKTGLKSEHRAVRRKVKGSCVEKSSIQVLVPKGFFHSIRGTLRSLFAANDGVSEDLSQFLEDWEARNPGSLFADIGGRRTSAPDTAECSEVDVISHDEAALLSAITLVTQSIERTKGSDGAQLEHGHTEHIKADAKRAELLALVAQETLNNRSKREIYLPGELFGEPGWEMLLDLAIQYEGRNWISTKSLCIASGAPSTTALRYIKLLRAHGLVRSKNHPTDKRGKLHMLSSKGYQKISELLADVHRL